MRPLYKIAVKDLKLLIRDKSGFFFTFFFPFIVAILFGFIFSTGGGGTGTMSVLLVDDDNTPASRKFIEVLQNASEINVIPSDLDNARNLVRTGKVVAYLRIQKGFGEAYQRLFYGDPPELEVGVDPSRRAESAMLEGILMKYGSRRFQDLFTDTAAMKRNIDLYREDIESDAGMEPGLKEDLGQLMGDLDRFYSVLPQENASGRQTGTGQAESTDEAGPVFTPLKVTMSEVRRIRTGPSNSFEVTFPQGMIWGIIGVAAAFGISIVVERTRGTLQRLRIAPIGIAHILAGKAIACMITTIAICAVLMFVGVTLFKIRVSSYPMLVCVIVSVAAAFTGTMMLLSVLGRTERSVAGIGWAVMLVMAMFGGGMIPMVFMPAWMVSLGSFSPVKWAILAFEGAIWRGFTPSDMLMPVAVLIGTSVITFVAGTIIFRRMEVH